MPGAPRVLVAEDEPEMLAAVAEELERLGAHVVRAVNGDELLTHLSDDEPFALVVSDVSMPWMSGLQAMHSARYAGHLAPIIIITGLPDQDLPARVRALGHAAYLLRKPFGLDALRALAIRLLDLPAPDAS